MTTQTKEFDRATAHVQEWGGVRNAVFNPMDVDPATLPIIYGFNNGGSPGFYYAQLIAEDGEVMGSHLCSHEGYMPGDLGIIEGHRADRHESFKMKYPSGYRMCFVPYDEVDTHPGLEEACLRNQAESERVEAERVANLPTEGEEG